MTFKGVENTGKYVADRDDDSENSRFEISKRPIALKAIFYILNLSSMIFFININ